MTDGGLDPEQARGTVRPGDVVVSTEGWVVRCVESGDQLKGIRYDPEIVPSITRLAWEAVDEYHPREQNPEPTALVDEDDQDESDDADVQDDADGDEVSGE